MEKKNVTLSAEHKLLLREITKMQKKLHHEAQVDRYDDFHTTMKVLESLGLCVVEEDETTMCVRPYHGMVPVFSPKYMMVLYQLLYRMSRLLLIHEPSEEEIRAFLAEMPGKQFWLEELDRIKEESDDSDSDSSH